MSGQFSIKSRLREVFDAFADDLVDNFGLVGREAEDHLFVFGRLLVGVVLSITAGHIVFRFHAFNSSIKAA